LYNSILELNCGVVVQLNLIGSTSPLIFAIILIVITTGAGYIGEFLKRNCTLKVLHVDNNCIGDVGISQLMNGLKNNTTLTELYVVKCGLSAKGTIYTIVFRIKQFIVQCVDLYRLQSTSFKLL